LTFAIAILIPSQILLSIFGVIVLIVSGFVEKLVTDIEYSPYLSILDPSGRAAADLDMKYWTPLDYREKYLRLENFYLLNRSVWIFISGGIICICLH
jgi:ABC-2 type transport system permease protein